MNSGMFDSNGAFGSDWGNTPDASEFLFDSPVPHNQDLFNVAAQDGAPDQRSDIASEPAKRETNDDSSRPHLAVPRDSKSQQSSTSPTDSRSSSSNSPNQPKLSTSTSPPTAAFAISHPASSDLPSHGTFGVKMDNIFPDDDAFPLDSNYPSVNSDMDHLSLNTSGGFDFSTMTSPSSALNGIFANERDQDLTPRTLGAINSAHAMNASPMTVSPQKMFSLGSREESPNDMAMHSGQSSPFPLNKNSPMGNLGSDFSNNTIASKMESFSGGKAISGQGIHPGITSNAGVSAAGLTQPALTDKWPCKLFVDPTPEKSRVETQIPIKLTLKNPPVGFTRLHLPSYTISKPKFQQKPPFDGDDETLELSVSLVCASAMQQKDGALERAFMRAEAEEVHVRNDDTPPSNQDENDPERPLNGGPVAICPGCVVRERKRANRKKNKKVEEEEEWQRDEAKRVIVFNCQEIKDWCVPGTKETPVKDQRGTATEIFVNAPMRIACYCRHQSEKIGFQVIFTIRKPNSDIIAQGISQSIMITDDHKQPPPSAMQSVQFSQAQQPGPTGMFAAGPGFSVYPHGQPFGGHPAQDLPFRPSFSVPNLSQMAQQIPQFQSNNAFPRQFSSSNLSQSATPVSATPRTLSRPASPTGPVGQPGAKKRRSGGAGHAKMPSGLSMTKIDTKRSTPPSSAGPLTAASNSTSFAFQSPTSSSFATTPLDGSFPQAQHMRHSSATQPYGGTSTPHPQAFSAEPDFSQFYSAPTSQHQSRAPSPQSGNRFAQQQNYSQHVNPGLGKITGVQTSIPSQAAAILRNLPAGLNLNRPPIIQRLIPAEGSVHGGTEVTVLGSGFFQGLEVMFGDSPASNTTFWGDTTLVSLAPPGMHEGTVNVVFSHQHPHEPNNISDLPQLMPAQYVPFNYVNPSPNPNGGARAFAMTTNYGPDTSSHGPPAMNVAPNLSSAHGGGSPLNGSPGMDDAGIGSMQGISRSFFAQGASPAQTPPRQQPLGSGSAGFNAAAQARRLPLSRTVSGDGSGSAFRRTG